MSKEELECMQMQLKVLKSLEVEYKGRIIGNIIDNIEKRIEHYESNKATIH